MPAPRPLPGLVTDLTGARHRPFVISEQMRKRMVDRVALHGPVSQTDLLDARRRIENLPLDVLFTLELLALMADKGNVVAADLLVSERERLGIDRRAYFGG